MSEVGLAETIQRVREELSEAQDAGAGHQFRFQVDEVEVELGVEVRKEGGINGKVQLGVVTVGADGRGATGSTHRVTLRLSVTDAATGRNLEVARDDERPWDG